MDKNSLSDFEFFAPSVKIVTDDQKMSVSGGGLVTQYNTTQFHFHWGNSSSVKGSEHTVDGTQYALEVWELLV